MCAFKQRAGKKKQKKKKLLPRLWLTLIFIKKRAGRNGCVGGKGNKKDGNLRTMITGSSWCFFFLRIFRFNSAIRKRRFSLELCTILFFDEFCANKKKTQMSCVQMR